jgi:transcriptional regulator with XRE-family HTH domain
MLSSMSKAPKPMSSREIFARNLRQTRRLKDLSQEALALQAGLSRTYLSEVERGTRNIAVDNMGLLAETLGVPLSDLVNPSVFKVIGKD